MKTYLVGGAIRDQLLGLARADHDYVVVGSSPEEMLELGFLPVGKDFPVFLHPQTKDEYALARTERKVGQGYKGFEFYTAPDISLEDDLARRDFTVNAIAQEVDTSGQAIGPLIDPFQGQLDLSQKIFRHIGPAFTEDPLRILRLARFLARFKDFSVDPQTQKLVSHMVQDGELRHLVAERVWQELSRGLMEPNPSRMLGMLATSQAIQDVFPQDLCQKRILDKTVVALDQVASSQATLPLRVASLMNLVDLEQILSWTLQLKVPLEIKSYAIIFRKLRSLLEKPTISAKEYLQFLDQADFWRKPERLLELIQLAKKLDLQAANLEGILLRLKVFDTQEIVLKMGQSTGAQIGQAIVQSRLQVIEACL